MAESDGTTEFDLERILEFAKTDRNGPGDRTKRVYTHLAKSGQFTNWDLICFCSEYIASQVGTLPWLEPPAKWLIRLVYMAHYVRFKEAAAWLDRSPLSAQEQPSEMDSGGDTTPGP